MASLMFDSDQPEVLLATGLLGVRVATYADLLTPALVKQFGPRLVVIDRGLGDPLGMATVADIEPGADSIARGAALLKQWVAQKRPTPTAYHDRADWPAVTAALAGTVVHHWVATLDGTASPDGQRPSVVQILGADKVGFHADLSIVWDESFHPLQAAAPALDVARLRSLSAAANSPFRALVDYIVSL